MTTLDEAIEHCLEKAKDRSESGREHLQLARWLRELKFYKGESNDVVLDNNSIECGVRFGVLNTNDTTEFVIHNLIKAYNKNVQKYPQFPILNFKKDQEGNINSYQLTILLRQGRTINIPNNTGNIKINM